MSDGGGGGSYADLPDYIKYAHMDMIHGTTDDTQIDYLFALGDSLWWKTNLALDSRSYIEKNPYEMFDIPDPDGRLANLIYSIDHLKANIVPEVSVGSDITSHLNQARTDILNNFVGAFDDNLSGKLDTIISGAVTKAQTLLNTMAPEALTNVKSVGNDVRASAFISIVDLTPPKTFK